MSRAFLIVSLACLIGIGPMLASGPQFTSGAVWADDDDDDDDDDDGGRARNDDDDDGPRRRVQAAPRVQRAVRPAAPAPRVARAPAAAPAPLQRAAPNEIVVLALAAADLLALQTQGFSVIEERDITTLASTARRLRTPDGVGLEAARALVRDLPTGLDADLNHFYRSEQGFDPLCRGDDCPIRTAFGWTVPDDRMAGCGLGLRIGVVDTGLNPDHDTFDGAALTVLDFDAIAGDTSREQHGTAVAAMLIGRPDTRSPGLVPQAQVFAIDPFHRTNGDERADVFSLLDALDRIGQQDVSVLNLSLAGPQNAALEQMIRNMIRVQDIVVVAAAGNAGPQADPLYPAAIDDVIAVTAIDRDQRVYRRAVQGDHVDLAAPGVNVWTAASVSGARLKTGTSFATPFVTAAAGLMRLQAPDLPAVDVAAALKAAATDLGDTGPDRVFGAGLVPAADATCRLTSGAARPGPPPVVSVSAN